VPGITFRHAGRTRVSAFPDASATATATTGAKTTAWFTRTRAVRISRREAKREAKAKKGVIQRTCRNCGHTWMIPKALTKATTMGMLGGDSMWASTMVAERTKFGTCATCGSVAYFTEKCL
jgi:poly(3-hydroxybutyrate) depolymerase